MKFISYKDSFITYNSGDTLQVDIVVGIYDQHDQLISNDNVSVCEIRTSDLNSSVAGINKVVADNGVFRFKALKIIGKPSYSTKILITNDELNSLRRDL